MLKLFLLHIEVESNRNKVIKGDKSFSEELMSNKLHEPSMKSLIMYNMWEKSSKNKGNKLIADYQY